ncbi:hypothetical protein CDD83_328 [Cordyceps sp. RAO-2017]|nr:hypothetical protein CDD83_328 [Cordyceps sp. RAO-2017]
MRADHVSGARALAGRAVGLFADVVAALDAAPPDCWWRAVRLGAWHLWKNGREAMGASVLAALSSCLDLVEARLPTGPNLPAGFVDDVVAGLRDLGRRRHDEQAASSGIRDAFSAFVQRRHASLLTSSASPAPDPAPASRGGDEAGGSRGGGDDTRRRPLRILTLSSSSTIASSLSHALAQAQLPPLDTRVLESRPLCEGASMARVIAAAAAPPSSVSVYTDAAAALAARGADLVLLGADLIDRHGNVSNKMGSLPAVLAARHVAPAAKVVVLADRDKILPLDPPARDEDNDPAQVSRVWPAADDGRAASAAPLHVSNVYFEWVPAGLVDHYITEDGMTTTEGIAACARDARRRADHFFSDL